MYSRSFGRRRANRSPDLKPCLLSIAAMQATRSFSSRKVGRRWLAANAVLSGLYRTARPRECAWIIRRTPRSGLYELDIQINSYFVTNENATSFERCIPSQAEVFTADLCVARDGYPCITPGILRRRSRSFYIERHLSRDTVNRQVSLDGKLCVLNLFNPVRLERKKRVLFHIKEIRAFQMCIALSIARFDRSRLDRDLDA